MKPYVVKQGDFLAKIAFKMGFDADEVWNDDKNADLKAKRKDGDILLPGDVLYVPDDPRKKNPFTKETANAYKAKLPRAKVKVALTGPGGKPLADEPYVVDGIGDDAPRTTDGSGNVIFTVPVTVREVELTLTKRKQTFRVMVGQLDPVGEPSGARMRLEHLGLYSPSFAPGDEPYASRDEAQLAAALAAFQIKKGLPSTGKLDAATQAALVAAHGS